MPGVRVKVKGVRVSSEASDYWQKGDDMGNLYSCILPMTFKENSKGFVVGIVLHIDF